MIVGTLAYSSRIEELHPDFAQVFAFVKTHDLLEAPLERIDLEGGRVYINNVAPACVSAEDQPLEAHKKYIDIHILLEGKERIGWKDIDACMEPSQSYDEEGDYMLFHEPATTYVDLTPGQFVIVYPEDAHAPIIGVGKIRKLIVKIPVY